MKPDIDKTRWFRGLVNLFSFESGTSFIKDRFEIH
jgi:hypothetical protein